VGWGGVGWGGVGWGGVGWGGCFPAIFKVVGAQCSSVCQLHQKPVRNLLKHTKREIKPPYIWGFQGTCAGSPLCQVDAHGDGSMMCMLNLYALQLQNCCDGEDVFFCLF
jgi:hypothetical protein